MTARLTDAQGPDFMRVGRLRRAWCEVTGGHRNTILLATTITGPFAVRLHCVRCGRLTPWFSLPDHPRALQSQESGNEG